MFYQIANNYEKPHQEHHLTRSRNILRNLYSCYCLCCLRYNYFDMNYPAGANYDSRAPWQSSRPTKVNVIVEENEWQFPNDRLNFRVTEHGYDLGGCVGLGATLEAALEDFEDDYILKHNEAIEMIIVKTKPM